MVSGMIKVVCGTITGVVSLINIVTMIVALSHSSNLSDGTLRNKIILAPPSAKKICSWIIPG